MSKLGLRIFSEDNKLKIELLNIRIGLFCENLQNQDNAEKLMLDFAESRLGGKEFIQLIGQHLQVDVEQGKMLWLAQIFCDDRFKIILRKILFFRILTRAHIKEGEDNESVIVFGSDNDLEILIKLTSCSSIEKKFTKKFFTTVRGSSYEVNLSLNDATRLLRSIKKTIISDLQFDILDVVLSDKQLSSADFDNKKNIFILDGLNLGKTPTFEGFLHDWMVVKIASVNNEITNSMLPVDTLLDFLEEKLQKKYSSSKDILQMMFTYKEEGLIRPHAHNEINVIGIGIMKDLNFHRMYNLKQIYEENDPNFLTKDIESILRALFIRQSKSSSSTIQDFRASLSSILQALEKGSEKETLVIASPEGLKDRIIYNAYKEMISKEVNPASLERRYTARKTLNIVRGLHKGAQVLGKIINQILLKKALSMIALTCQQNSVDEENARIEEAKGMLNAVASSYTDELRHRNSLFLLKLVGIKFMRDFFDDKREENLIGTFDQLVFNLEDKRFYQKNFLLFSSKISKVLTRIKLSNNSLVAFAFDSLENNSQLIKKKIDDNTTRFVQTIQAFFMRRDHYMIQEAVDEICNIFTTRKKQAQLFIIMIQGVVKRSQESRRSLGFKSLQRSCQRALELELKVAEGYKRVESSIISHGQLNGFTQLKKSFSLGKILRVLQRKELLSITFHFQTSFYTIQQTYLSDKRKKAKYQLFLYRLLNLDQKHGIRLSLSKIKVQSAEKTKGTTVLRNLLLRSYIQEMRESLMRLATYRPEKKHIMIDPKATILFYKLIEVLLKKKAINYSNIFMIKLKDNAYRQKRLSAIFNSLQKDSKRKGFNEIVKYAKEIEMNDRLYSIQRHSVIAVQKNTTLNNFAFILRCYFSSVEVFEKKNFFGILKDTLKHYKLREHKICSSVFILERVFKRPLEQGFNEISCMQKKSESHQKRLQMFQAGIYYLEMLMQSKQKKKSLDLIHFSAVKRKHFTYSLEALDWILTKIFRRNNGAEFFNNTKACIKKSEGGIRLLYCLIYKEKLSNRRSKQIFFLNAKQEQKNQQLRILSRGVNSIENAMNRLQERNAFRRINFYSFFNFTRTNKFAYRLEIMLLKKINTYLTNGFVNISKRALEMKKLDKLKEIRARKTDLQTRQKHPYLRLIQVENAARLIQGFFKAWVMRSQYLRFRSSIIKFQRLWRKKHARLSKAQYRKLRESVIIKLNGHEEKKSQRIKQQPQSICSSQYRSMKSSNVRSPFDSVQSEMKYTSSRSRNVSSKGREGSNSRMLYRVEKENKANNIDMYEKEYLERKVKNSLRRIRQSTKNDLKDASLHSLLQESKLSAGAIRSRYDNIEKRQFI